jgi:hypothetical protein
MVTEKKPGIGRKMKLFPGSELPPNIIISLKALLLYVLLIHPGIFLVSVSGLPFLPFLKFLDTVPFFVFSFAAGVLLLSIFLVFLRKGNYQLLSLVSGLIILVIILSSKNLFSNSLTYVACLLVLIGLYRGKTIIFRVQISLLYLGAAINKIFDPDWWTGLYFDYFFRDIFNVTLYTSYIPADDLSVATFFGVITIFIECLLGIIVLIPGLTRLTIILGFLFHGGMLLVTSGILSVRFFYIMSASYLMISGLNIKRVKIIHNSGFIARLLSFADFSDSVVHKKTIGRSLAVSIGNNTWKGYKALQKLLFSYQYFFSIFFVFLIYSMVNLNIFKRIISTVFQIIGGF